MEVSDGVQLQISMEMSTVMIVKNRCQFCYAFFKNPEKIAEHSNRCLFRFSETFVAFNGKVKFACAVCFDVFQTRVEHARHEQLHKLPGGFLCSICNEIFLNDFERSHHIESAHGLDLEESRYSACSKCGAYFEQKTYLRLHEETECGQHRNAARDRQQMHDANDGLKTEPEVDAVRVFPDLEVVSIDMTLGSNESEPMEYDSLSAPATFIEPYIPVPGTSDYDEEDQSVEYLEEENSIIANEGTESCEEPNNSDGQDVRSYNGDGDSDPTRNLIHKCTRCRLLFATVSEMNKHHIENHQNELECAICRKTFTYRANLWNHIRSVHRNQEGLYENTESRITSPSAQFDGADIKLDDGKTHKCSYCAELFNTKRELYEHNEAHHATEYHKCNLCGLNYKRIWVHMRRHSNRKSYTCEYCDRKFFYRQSMAKHLSIHTGVMPYECVSCKESFLNSIERRLHRCSATKKLEEEIKDGLTEPEPKQIKLNVPKTATLRDKKYSCKYCNMKYTREIYLMKHIVVHGTDGRLVHKCDCCLKYFVSKDEMNVHKKKLHQVDLTCKICNRYFDLLDKLHTHNRNKHANAVRNKHMCIKCGKSFVNKSTLSLHEESDCGNSLNYKCNECGKILSNKYTLQTHQRSHDEKSFLCKTCDKMFATKNTLLIHTRIHTGERPYACNQCEKSFMDRNSLNLHTTVHTGFKRYICRNCGARFSCHSNLRAHRRVRKNSCGLLPMTNSLIKMNSS